MKANAVRKPLPIKVLLGTAFWIAVALLVTAAARSLSADARRKLDHVKVEMQRALLDPAPTYDVVFDGATWLERNNGVLAVVDGRLERVGEVVRLHPDPVDQAIRRVTIAIDSARSGFVLAAGSRATRRSQGTSFLFALKTLLPEARMRRVEQEWQAFWTVHQRDLVSELQPVVDDLFQGGARLMQEELGAALARHQRELVPLIDRLRGELARDQVLPLLVEDLWPIVVQHAAAPAERIGRELWDRVPLMAFAWRAAADKVLDDKPARVEERWRTFVEEEALPTLRSHDAEIQEAFGAILHDALTSESVRARGRAALDVVVTDPEVKRLASVLARELFLENPRIGEFVKGRLADPAVRARLNRVSDRLQTFLDPIGDLIFLDDRQAGLNPDLAYLIRLLLLRRDAQVLYLESGAGEPLAAGSTIEGRHEP